MTLAFSLARAARNPALEELYFLVLTPVISPSKSATRISAQKWVWTSTRRCGRVSRATGEITYFRNRINDYIFRDPISEEEFEAVSKQDRVCGEETPTDGYSLLRLFGSYSFGGGRVVHTITGRLENATDALYRNHLSLVKDNVPEMGRNLKLVYCVRF
jgi:hypothetical protein